MNADKEIRPGDGLEIASLFRSIPAPPELNSFVIWGSIKAGRYVDDQIAQNPSAGAT
jgi:hypothetical protein